MKHRATFLRKFPRPSVQLDQRLPCEFARKLMKSNLNRQNAQLHTVLCFLNVQ